MNAFSPFLKSLYNLFVSCCLHCHEFDKFLSSEVNVKLSSVSSYAHEKLLYLKSFLKSFDLLASIFVFSGYFD